MSEYAAFLTLFTKQGSMTVPVSQTTLKTLYIFVEIAIDTPHLALSVRRNFPSARSAFQRAVVGADTAETGGKVSISLDPKDAPSMPDEELPTRLALVSTIQFVAAVQALRTDLETALPPVEQQVVDQEDDGMLAKMRKRDIGVWRGKYEVTVPQAKPLSPGEVLGCTAPKLNDVDGLMWVWRVRNCAGLTTRYVGDGRFHLESIMIANPTVPAFRYDPYSKKFTRETYEHKEMRTVRGDAVKAAKKGLAAKGAGSWAVLLGTLGRQGSLSVLRVRDNRRRPGH
jgi:2-(3-amino-3-carboxypropyl)histidine synthase